MTAFKDLISTWFKDKNNRVPPAFYTVGKIAKAMGIPQATIESWLRRDIFTDFLSEEAKLYRQFNSIDVAGIVFFNELRQAGLEADYIKERLDEVVASFAEMRSEKPALQFMAMAKGTHSQAAIHGTPVGEVVRHCGPITVLIDLVETGNKFVAVINAMGRVKADDTKE